jgi:hypothetical protein
MRTNRFLAVLLAATMVFGSAVTAFAADPDTGSATGTQSVDGVGNNEGYVNTTVLKVVLPTTSASTFAFIMDPQELLKDTNGGSLGTAWTSPGADDTFVYFKTTKGYANESDTVYFINKSTDQALDVTVNAKISKVKDTDTLITLAADADAGKHSVTDADKLYLGLKAGGQAVTVTDAAAGVNAIVKAANSANEYTVLYNSKTKKYELTEKAGATFQAVPISVVGSVTHKATEKAAPKLTLTWTWAAQDNGVTATTGAKSVNYVTTNAYTVTNATLDQTATAYGSFYGGIGKAKGGKLTINGTASSVITFADDIDTVEYSETGSSYEAYTALVTGKGKAVTIKGSVWNGKDSEGEVLIPSGAKIKVTFKDPDNDDTTSNTPADIFFEKP